MNNKDLEQKARESFFEVASFFGGIEIEEVPKLGRPIKRLSRKRKKKLKQRR